MKMNPPTVPLNYAPFVQHDELVHALRLIHHATKPEPDDGGHHEAAFEIADSVLKRVDARVADAMLKAREP